MRFLKNKILWLTLYAIGITFVFLFLLFPSQLVLQRIEAATSASEYVVKAEGLRPALPLGFKFHDLTVRPSQSPESVLFRGDALDLQFNPFSFFSKLQTVYFSGKAYSGSFDGQAGFASVTKSAQPAQGKINFKNIDLARCSLSGPAAIKGISGIARGAMTYSAGDGGAGPSGKLSVYLVRGAYPLPEPFLGVSRIEFERGEVQAQLKGATVKVNKFEFYGAQVNCFLNGDIQLGPRIDQSLLNLKGTLEIVGKTKIKMNVTVGGTMASPSFRYL